MAPSPLQQRRTHNTLLFQKLLNLRDGASPFTLVLDTLEQSGAPIVIEFAKRAKMGNSRIIVISYQTLRSKVSFEHDVFISARHKSLSALRNEILSHTSAGTAAPSSPKYLLIIDTLHPLASTNPQHLSLFLSSLLSPNTSLIATLTTDIPILSPRPTNPKASQDYQPEPPTILAYLATAILYISSLSRQIAKKRARDRSRQEPSFGLQERKEGVLFGLRGEQKREESVVVDMELRRKSGRGILETFVLTPTTSAQNVAKLMLLDDHPLYSPPIDIGGIETKENEEVETTFSLGLTEKQRKDREGVVLPYFDAQKEGGTAGAGEGGRILYEMGFEDREDFDDEEDEI